MAPKERLPLEVRKAIREIMVEEDVNYTTARRMYFEEQENSEGS